MNKTVLICVILFLLISCGQPFKLQKFSSEEGRFSVLLPGNPEKSEQTISTAAGPINITFFMVSRKNGVYGVGYCDYPSQVFLNQSLDKMLDDAMNEAIGNIEGTLKKETDFTLEGGVVGREIEAYFSKPGKPGIFRAAYYLDQPRFFQVIITTTMDIAYKPVMDEILKSLEI